MEKIIVCSPQLGLSPKTNLGGEVYDREIIEKLCNLGVRVVVILPFGKKYKHHKNLKVYFLPIPIVWPPFIFNFLIIPWLFYIYWKEKFNILRVHSPYFTGIGALIFKIFYSNVPIVATYHHLEDEKLLYRLINKLFINKWDKIVTDSGFCKKELIENYDIKNDKIKIVYSGIKKRRLKSAITNNLKKRLIAEYKLENKKVLLSLGNLSKRKNLGFLLEVLKGLDDNVVLIICGKGKEKERLKSKAEKLGVKNRVFFAGFVKEEEKQIYFNLADVFVFASKKEGFGISVLEAEAYGLPVVVSNNSSLPEVVKDGKSGYLCDLGDRSDWSDKIKKLLENDKLRKKMGRNAKKFAKKFTWKKSAKKFLKICNSRL